MNALFVNSPEPVCGAYQFGLNLWRILRQSDTIQFSMVTPSSSAELLNAIVSHGVDLIFYNFHPSTMPWVNLQTLTVVRRQGIKQVSIFHELPISGFDALIYPDPTFVDASRQLVDCYGMGRPLPEYNKSSPTPQSRSSPTIGGSGFGFQTKGFQRLVRQVAQEFSQAKLRLRLPFAVYGDRNGDSARAVAQECQAIAAKHPGIQLEISHDFLSPTDYLDWLAENDLNAYLYDEMPGRGIASTIDHALAVGQPIATTRTTMFRHLSACKPSVFIEDNSLRQIMQNGTAPLIPLYKAFRDEIILGRLEKILALVLAKPFYNRLLTNSDRLNLAPLIREMQTANPQMMTRKIAAADVQQAWCLDMVRRCWNSSPTKTLCVGCFEDTAYATLPVQHVVGIDPVPSRNHNFVCDLAEFRKRRPDDLFDVIFACSVLEHVPDDEQFMRDLCDTLAPRGTCILTCDFNRHYQPGDKLPPSNLRFYTPTDIDRLGAVLETKSCYWTDPPDTYGQPDFFFADCRYSFMALAFKKL